LNFTTIKYALHKRDEILLHDVTITVYMPPRSLPIEFKEAENFPPSTTEVRTLIPLITDSREICSKNYIVRRPETLINCSASVTLLGPITQDTRNLSEDEIANVNFLYDDIVHVLKYNRLLHKFHHRSFSATQVYQIQ